MEGGAEEGRQAGANYMRAVNRRDSRRSHQRLPCAARNEMNARRPSRILLFVNERGDYEIALPASEGGDGTEGSEEQFAGGSPPFERIAK